MKYVLANENNSCYTNKITVPWDFINLASDSKSKDDIFVIDFNELISDKIDYDFYRSAIRIINNYNRCVKLFGISNDHDLISHFLDSNIKFVNCLP
jgi:hypothetical protein